MVDPTKEVRQTRPGQSEGITRNQVLQAVIFGLIFGTFLTLVLVPVLYLLAAKLKERVFRLSKKDAPGSEGAVALN